jgi:hypothetical protein
VKPQPVDDLVDHLALGAHGEADKVEIGADHRPHHFAVSSVVRGLEHVLGINRRLHVTRQCPLQRARKRRPICAIDQDRLAYQRKILSARAVCIGLADAFRKCRRNTAGQECSDIQLLSRFEVGSDHDRDLGIELH